MTDCDRVLAALRSGPKTASELYGLHLIAHSRIADLRRKGHVITCTKLSGNGAKAFVYRLEVDAGALGAAEPDSGLGTGDSAAPSAPCEPEQLSLVAA